MLVGLRMLRCCWFGGFDVNVWKVGIKIPLKVDEIGSLID